MKLFVLFTAILVLWSCGNDEKVVWSDEFDTEVLNEAYWNFELGDGCPELCGWGNNEPQIYTKSNHTLKNGFLHVIIRKEDSIYTSTKITTEKKFEFQYGRLEARAKLPVGKGIWPAIWMLGSNRDEVGWPLCGEIDILEYVGREPHTIFNSLHTKDSHGNTINTKKTKIANIEEGFHIYEMDWSPEKIDFYVDENLMYSFAPKKRTEEIWPFDRPFYLILNSAIGGNFGGHDIDDSALPQEFIIDYVRVYKN